MRAAALTVYGLVVLPADRASQRALPCAHGWAMRHVNRRGEYMQGDAIAGPGIPRSLEWEDEYITRLERELAE
ncbi:hypothetical protein EVG20_g9302 [Dentipellis fragilis]|uniref:Uncharacterized protein n=1 Tax=Dentipellis fragilis TaxID=205917 RepID=A0A4Y9XZG5_9AGAM|nr:hypothetical protein EVG20_g9302 [Dentipellis fragilis]